MKIIGLEEHFVTADVLAAWRALSAHLQDVAASASGAAKLTGEELRLAVAERPILVRVLDKFTITSFPPMPQDCSSSLQSRL